MGGILEICTNKSEGMELEAENLLKTYESDIAPMHRSHELWVDALRRVYSGSGQLNISQMKKACALVDFDIEDFYKHIYNEQDVLKNYLKIDSNFYNYSKVLAFTLHFSEGSDEEKVKTFVFSMTLSLNNEMVRARHFASQMEFLAELSLKIIPQEARRNIEDNELMLYARRLQTVKNSYVKYCVKLFYGTSREMPSDELSKVILATKEGMSILSSSRMRMFANRLFFLQCPSRD